MAITASDSVTINAPLADVLAVVNDVPSQAEWFPGTISAEVTETGPDGLAASARMVSDVKVAKDEFDVDFTHTDASVSWKLVAPSKSQKDQQGSWELKDVGGKTEAKLTLTVDSSLPLPGFIQKKAIGDTVKNACKALKARCEG